MAFTTEPMEWGYQGRWADQAARGRGKSEPGRGTTLEARVRHEQAMRDADAQRLSVEIDLRLLRGQLM